MRYKLQKVSLKRYYDVQNNESYCSKMRAHVVSYDYIGGSYALVDQVKNRAITFSNLEIYPILKKNEIDQILDNQEVKNGVTYATDLKNINYSDLKQIYIQLKQTLLEDRKEECNIQKIKRKLF